MLTLALDSTNNGRQLPAQAQIIFVKYLDSTYGSSQLPAQAQIYAHVMTWPSNAHQSKRKKEVEKNSISQAVAQVQLHRSSRAVTTHMRTQAKASIATFVHALTV